ncbi:MAG: hypothetical protein PUD16_05815 [bacterium]|nr:hypothetical protein [bacterium]
MNREKLKKSALKALRFITNPRFLLCFGLAWIITNGWSYVMLAAGTYFGIGWMTAVAGAYMAFLWFPFSPEKVATFAIAMALLRWLFPKDEKTLKVMKELYASAKAKARAFREKHKAKKESPDRN